MTASTVPSHMKTRHPGVPWRRFTGPVTSLSSDEIVDFFHLDERATANLHERQFAILDQCVEHGGADAAQPLSCLSDADEPPSRWHTQDLRAALSGTSTEPGVMIHLDGGPPVAVDRGERPTTATRPLGYSFGV
jgi:hypothetical protein